MDLTTVIMMAPEGKAMERVGTVYYRTNGDGEVFVWPQHVAEMERKGYLKKATATIIPPPSFYLPMEPAPQAEGTSEPVFVMEEVTVVSVPAEAPQDDGQPQ